MKNMKAKSVILIIGVAALAVFACSSKNGSEAEGPVTERQTSVSENKAEAVTLPAFRMLDREGNVVSLQSFKGKKVFVNLWATWCPPCRREMPSIESLYKSVDKSKVAFVMLSLDDDFQKAKQYAASRKLTLPILYPAENLPQLFNVDGIPATFIFDEEGKLIKQVNGSDDYNAESYRTLLK
jgi:thiol-disulfide isomerase/thioredoxin